MIRDDHPLTSVIEAMVYVLAVAAALSNALTSVFQRMGVEDAPEETTMRLSLMAHAVRRGVWLLGFAFMICSFLLQSFALHIGRLSVVQPILTMELLFLVAILGTYFRFQITYREWIGPAPSPSGWPASSTSPHPAAAEEVPTNLGWIVVGTTTCGLIVLAVVATRWGPRWWKAAMFGTAAAITYAFTAALIKMVSDYRGQRLGDPVRALADLRRHRLRAARPLPHAERVPRRPAGRLAVDPGPGRPAGQHLPGYRPLRRQPAHVGPYGPLEALSLLLMFIGAVFLSHSPLITGMKSEGKGVEYEEMLSRQLKHPHPTPPRARAEPVRDTPTAACPVLLGLDSRRPPSAPPAAS